MLKKFFKIKWIQKKYLLWMILCSAVFPIPAYTQNPAAQEGLVTLEVSDKLTSYGEFYPGEKDKPAVLILHGFMLTHNFPTVKRLAEALHDSGYTIITPTLSLGINKRKQSLPCDAIHTHSLDKDIEEINQWVHWLSTQSNRKIVLIGHSTGASQIINYIHNYPDAPVQHIILLSLPSFGDNPNSFETAQDQKRAQQNIDKNELMQFALSYCKNYVTTPRKYLSYYGLSQTKLHEYIKQSGIQKSLILGSEDTRVDKSWNKSLVSENTRIIFMEGANHFFDNEYEFDLLDAVEDILADI